MLVSYELGLGFLVFMAAMDLVLLPFLFFDGLGHGCHDFVVLLSTFGLSRQTNTP